MKVLFVDDERRVLDGLERMLFHLDDWEVTCVESGTEALAELAEESFSVIVTDMRMPGMDGATLLRKVHDQFPDVIRIVLSGHAEEEAALRVVPVAHQFLSKPSSAETVQSVIEGACALRAVLTNESVRDAVGKIDRLPSLPRVYAELTHVLANSESGANDVARVVMQDPAMCAKILQLVNSAFFSLPAAITDIRQAIVRLGFQMVKNLALSVEVFAVTDMPSGRGTLSVDALQRRALHTGTLARLIMDDRKRADDAFMAAMLHDVGKLVLATKLPDHLQRAYDVSQETGVSMHEAENVVLGVSHAEIGAYLLSVWGLPYPIIEAVASHHEPWRVTSRQGFGTTEAVYVADCLANGRELNVGYLEGIGIADRIDDWREIASSMDV